jgi:hypothetical protein
MMLRLERPTTGDSQSHFTTIAQFVSSLGEPMAQLFA